VWAASRDNVRGGTAGADSALTLTLTLTLTLLGSRVQASCNEDARRFGYGLRWTTGTTHTREHSHIHIHDSYLLLHSDYSLVCRHCGRLLRRRCGRLLQLVHWLLWC
jgi:hypothetical protein